MQIAIFGGSFDPIHIAHVEIVKKVLESLNVDKVVVVPTYLNPFKSNFHIKPETRYKLLKKVFQKYENVQVCDFEINQKKTTYSIDTIKYLNDLYKPSKTYFIIGSDNLNNLNKWYKYEELISYVEFVAITRDGFESTKFNHLKIIELNIPISSSNLREKMDLNYIPIEIRKEILNLHKIIKGSKIE